MTGTLSFVSDLIQKNTPQISDEGFSQSYNNFHSLLRKVTLLCRRTTGYLKIETQTLAFSNRTKICKGSSHKKP